jgi:hypothetical protein
MRNSDKPDFVKTLNGLQAIKPGQKLTPEAIDIWWMAMHIDWSIEDFKAAASHLATAVEFMPSPFHFAQLRKAGRPTADEAWQVALDRCKQWRTPREALDDVDRTAAAIGGYRVIALADQETALPHRRREFIEAYDKIAVASEVRAALPSIAPAPELPAPRTNCRDGKAFVAITAPPPAPKAADQPKALVDQSREEVAEWLTRAGQ